MAATATVAAASAAVEAAATTATIAVAKTVPEVATAKTLAAAAATAKTTATVARVWAAAATANTMAAASAATARATTAAGDQQWQQLQLQLQLQQQKTRQLLQQKQLQLHRQGQQLLQLKLQQQQCAQLTQFQWNATASCPFPQPTWQGEVDQDVRQALGMAQFQPPFQGQAQVLPMTQALGAPAAATTMKMATAAVVAEQGGVRSEGNWEREIDDDDDDDDNFDPSNYDLDTRGEGNELGVSCSAAKEERAKKEEDAESLQKIAPATAEAPGVGTWSSRCSSGSAFNRGTRALSAEKPALHFRPDGTLSAEKPEAMVSMPRVGCKTRVGVSSTAAIGPGGVPLSASASTTQTTRFPLQTPAPVWKSKLDAASGKFYFWNTATKAVQWDRPVELGGLAGKGHPVKLAEEATMVRDVGGSGASVQCDSAERQRIVQLTQERKCSCANFYL